MADREKIIKGLERVSYYFKSLLAVGWQGDADIYREHRETVRMAIAMLKEQENEYEHGFNDAMLGKQELMYEGIDGKWHKKDW